MYTAGEKSLSTLKKLMIHLVLKKEEPAYNL